jgi:pyruvate-formate lyase-activating enzyme
MSYGQFVEIFTALYNETAVQNAFVDSLPSTIKEAFIDNEYTNSLAREKRLLLKHLFAQPIFEVIDYFLYDFKFGYKVIVDDVEYKPSNFDEILNFFKEVYYANN